MDPSPTEQPTPTARGRRRHGRHLARGAVVALAVALLPGIAGAQPAERDQSVGSLQEQARKLAAELDQLDRRTNDLDEQFNNASIELDRLSEKLAANQAEVDAAKQQLDTNRTAAQQYAVRAFVGSAADDGTDLFAGVDDATEASRRRTYMTSRYGDSEAVVDDLVAAQKDLADQEDALEAANAKVQAKRSEIDAARAGLEKTIAERKRLAASVNGQLAAALEAEQQRRAAAAEAAARAEAEAAAARAAAARRAPAVAVRANSQPASAPANGSGSSSDDATDDEEEFGPAPVDGPRQIAPPPADAPVAVRVALEQQGDPYRWAASGPDAFDCSGLVMFAYKAAGIQLPHSSRSLRSMTRSLSADELQPGDLVFGGSPVHHVGIYIGNGQMVHAPHSGDVVRVASIYSTSKPVTFGRL